MTKSKKQILTGIMSIIFHIFGVDRFLMKQKSEGFATLVKTVLLIAISSFLLKYSSLYYLTTMGIVEKVLLALIYCASAACFILVTINGIKGIINGVKILKMDPEVFNRELSYNAKSNPEVLRYKTLYQVDVTNLKNYNLVVDTDGKTPSEIANIISKEFENWLNK